MEIGHTSLALNADSKLANNLRLKNTLLKEGNPKHRNITTAVVGDGGAFWGVATCGYLLGIDEVGMGIEDGNEANSGVFDFGVGPSATGGVLAKHFAGQTHEALDIYLQDLTDHRFLQFRRMRADLDYLDWAYRSGPRKLDPERLKRSRSQLYVPVTEVQTGKGHMVHVQNPELDPVTALKATVSMPWICRQTVDLNGVGVRDGVNFNPLPIDYAVDELGAQNVMVMLLKPYGYRGSLAFKWFETAMTLVALRDTPPVFKKAVIDSHQVFAEQLRKLWSGYYQSQGIDVNVLCFDKEPFHQLTRDVSKLTKLANESRQKVVRALK